MPSSKIFLNFDSRKFSDDKGTQIPAMSGKRGSIREYELTVIQNNSSMSLPSGASVKVALKKTSDPAGTFLFEADAVRGGWGTGARWFYTLDLSDDAFDDLRGQVVDFEILLEFLDGQHIPSVTIPFTIQSNVIDG